MRKQLLDLQTKYKPGWDGGTAQPPNDLALHRADVALDVLEQLKITPTKLVPSVESGVAVIITDDRGHYADLEFFNNGDMCFAMFLNGEEFMIDGIVPRGTQPTKGDLVRVIQRIQFFLMGQHDLARGVFAAQLV